MARSRELKVVIAGDADKLERELKKSNNSLDKLGKQTRLTGTVTSKGFAAMRVGATGAAAAIGGLALAGKSVANAYIQAEKSEARLRAQLKASGLAYDRHSAQIEKSIQATSRLAGLDDEDLTDAFTNIIRVTGDVDKSLRLTGLAADFARAKHMDVAKAGELVGKVAGGNIGILSRYGIQVEKGATAQEALAELQAKFAGQAEAYGKTTGGAVDRASVAYENLQETVGEKLAPTIEKGANKLATFVDQMSTGTGQGGRFVDTLRDIWTQARPVVTWIGRATANVARFVAEHPNVGRLAAAVVGVGVAVKGLKFVSAATGFTDLMKAGRAVMKRLVAHFAAQGAVAGAAAGSAAAGGQGLTSAATFNKTRNAGSRLGRVGGRALGVGMAAGLLLAFPDIFKKVDSFENQLRDKLFGVGKDIAGKLNPFGDGLGNVPLPRGGGGNLMGADADLGPFAAIGRGLGLRVSSGLRPGAITSSGNPSNHATGDAIDMAGPPGKMLAYFRALKSRYGSRLAELIYTPGGVGIKDGRPHRYTGQVASDHYDHVHVAYRGAPAAGNAGADVNRRRRARMGDGIGEAVRAGRAAGFSGSELVTMVAIAGPESSYRNSARLVTAAEDSRGMWQINTKAHPWARDMNLTNAVQAAKAARRVWQQAGRSWRPWTAYTSGAYRRFIEQARAAVVGSRGGSPEDVRGGIDSITLGRSRGGSSTVDRAELAEKAGSRIVNALTRRHSPGIDRAIKAATRTGTLIEDAGTAYGQLERRFGQSEEDLGTADGRAKRTDELAALKAEKGKQLARAQRRAKHLKTGLARYDKLIKEARKKRDKAKGGTRARIVKRIKDFEDRRTDLAAELKAIENETIPDLQLDIGDLDKDIAEVAATEDTGAAEAREAAAEAAKPENRISSALTDIDLQERAGILSAEAANAARQSVLQQALSGAFGGLDQRQQWELMGQLRDAQQAATDAQRAATEAADAQTQALRELKASIDQQNAIASSTVGIQLAQASRALGDLVSGELGQRVGHRGTMPGSGQLASVGNSRL